MPGYLTPFARLQALRSTAPQGGLLGLLVQPRAGRLVGGGPGLGDEPLDALVLEPGRVGGEEGVHARNVAGPAEAEELGACPALWAENACRGDLLDGDREPDLGELGLDDPGGLAVEGRGGDGHDDGLAGARADEVEQGASLAGIVGARRAGDLAGAGDTGGHEADSGDDCALEGGGDARAVEGQRDGPRSEERRVGKE